jgi:hypothetical protein
VTEPEKGTASPLDHVLILAPYRKDAEYLGRLLASHGIEVRIGTRTDDLDALLGAAPGVLISGPPSTALHPTDSSSRPKARRRTQGDRCRRRE